MITTSHRHAFCTQRVLNVKKQKQVGQQRKRRNRNEPSIASACVGGMGIEGGENDENGGCCAVFFFFFFFFFCSSDEKVGAQLTIRQ